MLGMMLDPHYKGLALVIQFVGKEITLQISSEYGYHVLLPFLVSINNFLNPNDVGVGASSSITCSPKPTSLYELMETNEEMASSMVKE
jgi:hypothetical protein